MNPDDAFERILESLHAATLDDALWPAASTLIEEAIGASGSILAVSEGFGDDARVHFARYLYRGESHPDRVREISRFITRRTRGYSASGSFPTDG